MKIIIDGIDPIEIDTDEITGIRTKTSFSNENITINIFVQGDVNGNVETNGRVEVVGDVSGNVDANGRVEVGGNVEKKIDANGRVEVSGDTYGKIDAMGKVVIHGNKMK